MSPPASKFRQQFFFTLVRHPCHPHLVANKSSTKLIPHNCILHQGSVRIGRLVKQLKLSDRLWFWEAVGHAVSAIGSWAGTWFEHRFGWFSEMHGSKILSQEGCDYLQLHVRMYPWSFLLSFGLMPVLSLEVCRLDVYIYDYLVKRNLQAIAKAFLNECKVSSDPVGMLHASSRCMAMAIFT